MGICNTETSLGTALGGKSCRYAYFPSSNQAATCSRKLKCQLHNCAKSGRNVKLRNMIFIYKLKVVAGMITLPN